jgi:hypothetical protein
MVLLAIAATLVLAIAAPAYAFHTDGREGDLECVDCHGDDRDDWTGEGPHGYYTKETKKCGLCHTVHIAPVGGVKLLPAGTISDSCLSCHDGTGSVGVYSQITARGGTVAAEHRVDTTASVPGGSADLFKDLYCASCHSVHRATILEPYLRDTGKAFGSKEWIYSNNLLKDNVNGAASGTYAVYGAAWCAGCHDERDNIGPTHNHPVSITATYTLGRSNDGYSDSTADPYCQQCHEDYRDVETDFSASLKDYGYPAPDAPTNPEYTAFPHQSIEPEFLVEDGDDLCTNCHDAAVLP